MTLASKLDDNLVACGENDRLPGEKMFLSLRYKPLLNMENMHN